MLHAVCDGALTLLWPLRLLRLCYTQTVSDSEPVVGSDVTVKLEVFNPSARCVASHQ